MPGPKTHDIFYKELKEKLSEETISSFPNYGKFNIFAQGHDFLIYHNFYKIWNSRRLNQNIADSSLLQESQFAEFVYNYLKAAKNNGAIEDEQVRLFIGPGYAMHHILDAYTHPQIIYYAGDHTRNPNNQTWMHGIVENLIDIYLMEHKEKKNPNTYPVHKDFLLRNVTLSSQLVNVLDTSLQETYGIVDGGQRFFEAINQVSMYMKIFKYDPTGIKRAIFDFADPALKGTSSFSYHRNSEEALQFLNLTHEEWTNPMDDQIISTDSLLDLYDKALEDGGQMVDKLEKICLSSGLNRDDIYDIIPNISSIHGLESGKKLELKYTRKNK